MTRSAARALTIFLGEIWTRPVITYYELGVLAFRMYRDRCLGSVSVANLKKTVASRMDLKRMVGEVTEIGVLREHPDFPARSVFLITGKPQDHSVDVLCAVDPFAYLSHLSAMEFHGLTNRFSRTIYYSSPPARKWSTFARTQMEKDVGEQFDAFLDSDMPSLSRPRLTKISSRPLYRFNSLHLGAFVHVPNRAARVSSIGRTFLDMLRNPKLCGGMSHVLEVYESHAPLYVKLIEDELNQHGNKIERVRAGYILKDRCGLDFASQKRWLKDVQRGGSRKLDPDEPYDGTRISERWCISLNA